MKQKGEDENETILPALFVQRHVGVVANDVWRLLARPLVDPASFRSDPIFSV
jgi:hypothetical protein